MNKVKQLVIDRLIKTYGMPPETRVPSGQFPSFCAEYINALEGFSDDALHLGMNEIIKTNTYQTWPVPGAIHAACKKQVPSVRHESANWNESQDIKPRTAEEKARVRQMAQLFRESVQPMTKPKISDKEKFLNDTPYADIFRTDCVTRQDKEKRWSAAERMDGQLDANGMRKREYEAIMGKKL